MKLIRYRQPSLNRILGITTGNVPMLGSKQLELEAG